MPTSVALLGGVGAGGGREEGETEREREREGGETEREGGKTQREREREEETEREGLGSSGIESDLALDSFRGERLGEAACVGEATLLLKATVKRDL